MKTMLRWKIVVALAVVSLTSGFIGATLTLWWTGRSAAPPGMTRGAPASQVDDLYVSHLKAYLSLTDEQTAKIAEITRRARAEAVSKTGELGAVALARRRMLTEIRAVLMPDQAVRFDRLDELRSRALSNRKRLEQTAAPTPSQTNQGQAPRP